jgi:hypothetical protein
MPDWNRIIVGDAFKPGSRDLNYFRDLFLMWPFMVFSVAAISNLSAPTSSAYRVYGFKLAICAVVAILLAKERLLLFLVALLYVAMRLAVAIIFVHNWEIFTWLFVSGALLFLILRSRMFFNWKPSYVWPKGLRALDLIVGVSGLGAALGLGHWMKP